MESYEGGKSYMVRALDKGNIKTANPENHCCFLKAGYELWNHLAWGMLVSVIAFRPCLIICSGVGMVHLLGVFSQQTFCSFTDNMGVAYFYCSIEKSPQRFSVSRAYDLHGPKVDLF